MLAASTGRSGSELVWLSQVLEAIVYEGLEQCMTSVELTCCFEDVDLEGGDDQALRSGARLASLKKLAREEYLVVSYSRVGLVGSRTLHIATLTFFELFHDLWVVLHS